MVNARDIESRIDSVQNVRKITRTMKAVASAKLNRAQKRIDRAREYAEQMENVLRGILGRHPGIDHELFHDSADEGVLPPEEDTHPAYLVMTGDRGLCGSYNSNVFSKTEELLEDAAEPSLYLIGGRAIDYFNRHEGPILQEYSNIWDELDYEYSFQISDRLIEDYLNTEITSVTLVYQEFESAMVQHMREYPLLPLNRSEYYGRGSVTDEDESSDETAVENDRPDESDFDFEYEPDAEALIDRLFPRHVRTQVYTAMLDAYAALQGARMVAMDNATENANEMIDDLTLEYNQARQSAITREIADITGGAEALREG